VVVGGFGVRKRGAGAPPEGGEKNAQGPRGAREGRKWQKNTAERKGFAEFLYPQCTRENAAMRTKQQAAELLQEF
jgi:hypothetical protein